MACPAAKCRKECRLGGTGGGQIGREEAGEKLFYFFVPIFVVVCTSREEGRASCALPTQHAWVHGTVAQCPAEDEEV